MVPIKCAVVGDVSVGKTSTLVSYATNHFPDGPLPAVFDDYECNVMVDGRPFKLSLHDTGCLEEETSCQKSDVFLLMFSVVDSKSFENVQKKNGLLG